MLLRLGIVFLTNRFSGTRKVLVIALEGLIPEAATQQSALTPFVFPLIFRAISLCPKMQD